MTRWRAARADDVARLWPAARTCHYFRSADEFTEFHAVAPWRVRLSDAGDAMVLSAWRAHMSVLAIRGAWAAPHRIAALVAEADRVASAQGFSSVISHLMPAAASRDYLAAGMAVLAPIVVLQRELPVPAAAARHLAASVTIRRAMPADACLLERLDAECFPEFWRYGMPEIERAMGRERVAVAQGASGEALGYSATVLHGDVATLGRLAVSPAARRRGVGRMLVEDSLAWATGQGAQTLSLCTQEDNSQARALYRSAGLIEICESYALLSFETGRLGLHYCESDRRGT